jgi:hypothetical protein
MMDFDPILEQVLWHAASRVSPLLESADNDTDAVQAILRSSARTGDARRWYSGLEWAFAALEVLSSAGLEIEDPDRKMSSMWGALRNFPWKGGHVAPSWRLGLVRDYLARVRGFGTQKVNLGDTYAYYFGELDALVEEFEASESGIEFLEWARTPERVDEQWQRRRSTSFIERLEKDVGSSVIAFGATDYLHLVENYTARLEELTEVPDLMSACWAFHADFFDDRRPLLAAISLHRASLGERGLPGELDKFAEEERARSAVRRVGRLWSGDPATEPILASLSQSSLWARHRNKAQWKDVLAVLE